MSEQYTEQTKQLAIALLRSLALKSWGPVGARAILGDLVRFGWVIHNRQPSWLAKLGAQIGRLITTHPELFERSDPFKGWFLSEHGEWLARKWSDELK